MLKPVSTVSTSSGTADTKYTEAGSWTKFLSINVCICWSISYLHAYGNHRNNLIVSSIRSFFCSYGVSNFSIFSSYLQTISSNSPVYDSNRSFGLQKNSLECGFTEATSTLSASIK